DRGRNPEPAAVRTEPAGNHLLGNDGGDIARPDHAKRDAGHDADEIHRAFAERGGEHGRPVPPGEEADTCDRAPQDDVDEKGGAHSLSPSRFAGYIRTKTKRPSAPARMGS